MKYIMPLIFIAAAIAGFVMYTNPEYQKIKESSVSYKDIMEANSKATQLRAVRDKLTGDRAKIAEADFDKLKKMLPDGVENVRLVIDIDDIAKNHNMKIKNTRVNDISSRTGSTGAVGPDATKYGTISLSFSVTSSYDDFLSFLRDLETSERLVDVTNLSFSSTKNDIYDFNVTIHTYWLK